MSRGVKCTVDDILTAAEFWGVPLRSLVPAAVKRSIMASPKQLADKRHARLQHADRMEYRDEQARLAFDRFGRD